MNFLLYALHFVCPVTDKPKQREPSCDFVRPGNRIQYYHTNFCEYELALPVSHIAPPRAIRQIKEHYFHPPIVASP